MNGFYSYTLNVREIRESLTHVASDCISNQKKKKFEQIQADALMFAVTVIKSNTFCKIINC